MYYIDIDQFCEKAVRIDNTLNFFPDFDENSSKYRDTTNNLLAFEKLMEKMNSFCAK